MGCERPGGRGCPCGNSRRSRLLSSRPIRQRVQILGKPMIQGTWERAKMATTLDHVVVATDDEKIAECCQGFGTDVIMASKSCQNGTERCNEALQKLEKKYDFVVNIQGDEHLMEPEVIDGIVKALQVIKVDHEAQGVDIPEDVEKMERFMRERKLS